MTSVKDDDRPRRDRRTARAPGRRHWPGACPRCRPSPSSPTGMTAQQVADHVGVHRTIAYRLLSTLAQHRFVVKGEDGRYRPAAALAVLGASFDNNLRQLSVPTLRTLADDLGATVSLLVAEGDQQVAIAVIVPTLVFYQLSFHEGSRYPLERGVGGHRAAGQHAAAARRTRPGAAHPRAGLGDHPRRDRAGHLRPGGAGAPQTAVAADLHQPHLAPRGRAARRPRRGDRRPPSGCPTSSVERKSRRSDS